MNEPTAGAPAGQEFEHTLGQSDKTVAAFEGHEKNAIDRLQHFLHGNPTMVPVIGSQPASSPSGSSPAATSSARSTCR